MGGCLSNPKPNIPNTDYALDSPIEPLGPSSSSRTGTTQTAPPVVTPHHPSSSTTLTPEDDSQTTSTPLTASASRPSLSAISRATDPARKRRSFMSRSARPSLDALRAYATLPSPTSSLPPSVLLFANRQCLVVFDAYPKAKYHFLVLPRYPFPAAGSLDGQDSIVKLDDLDDLKSLLTKAARNAPEDVITAMFETAKEVEEMIRDEMVKTEGFEWKVDIGFHSVPSMKHLHLHVISGDRISPAMKTKKHHNSFRPDLGFFIDIMEVQRWIQQDEEFIHEHVAALSGAESLLDSTLACFKCDEPFHNMPKLKAHLEKEWNKEKKHALQNIRRTGRQRSSDEDDIF